MALFNDEELSRILSAHVNGELRRGGLSSREPGKCCVLQAAHGLSKIVGDIYFTFGYKENYQAAKWFDTEYNPGWPLGRFLRELEARGLA
jgi:hypothetical protein